MPTRRQATQGRLGGQRWVRRGLQHLVRGRRPSLAADARPTTSSPGGLCERSRPSPPRPDAGKDATYQRLRRAAPLPAEGPDGGPGPRPATRPRRLRARPHDGPPAGSGTLTDLFRPAAGPRASASSPPTTRTLELARAGAAEGCRCSSCSELSLMTSSSTSPCPAAGSIAILGGVPRIRSAAIWCPVGPYAVGDAFDVAHERGSTPNRTNRV